VPLVDLDESLFRNRLPLPFSILIGLGLAVTVVSLLAYLSFRSSSARAEAADRVTHTYRVIQQLELIGSTVKDVERGQRGFQLTGQQRYLTDYEPARATLPALVATLQALVSDNPTQVERGRRLAGLVDAKLMFAAAAVNRFRSGDGPGSVELLRSETGTAPMTAILEMVAQMQRTEGQLLAVRQQEWENTRAQQVVITTVGSTLLMLLIAAGAWTMARDYRARSTQAWLRTGQMGLSTTIQGEQRLEVLGDRILAYLATYLDAKVGAVYLSDGQQRFRRFAGYALPNPSADHEVEAGQGLIGQAAKEKRVVHATQVPAEYLPVSSGLGRRAPAEVLVVPACLDDECLGIIELGFFRHVTDNDKDLLGRASESLAVAIRTSRDRSRLEELLEETQRQAEELQTQQEELRVNNEELEEQSRALKESQSRLESQHAELEQINAHLEEHARLLETQKDDLERAHAALEAKATELERASQYKSEFLANMSHELRTPLNSSLILATLLADNRDGNLTPEQVQFARTIHEAGNDLLALINDILDLSKIESGKLDLTLEPVFLATTISSLVKSFEPLAQEKHLAFSATVDPGTPATIESDSQRLGQVLKNLLSNAVKFTEAGSVMLHVSTPKPGWVAFDVRDTGIGIPIEQHEIIFEAFRQADGSTHRRYGGTGLGLSISRDLAHLLGGDLTLASEAGKGSVFTLTVPIANGAEHRAPRVSRPPAAEPPARQAPKPVVAPPVIEDDRDMLVPQSRRILIVEDDVAFAGILRDLARENGFQSVVTHTAREGLAAAYSMSPSAILLDVNLPDHSGLGVLDQLKRDPRTRHIPVHVLSVSDFSQMALERGAIGYALKPVKREELMEAFEKFEAKLAQRIRRVLIVEDDARQRDSIRHLLASDGVEIVGAETGAAARALLQSTTFDCVVMDLKLPDMSGADLLEQMASDDNVSFPPVIVYTGRSLSRDEEQQLRRFSKSIIIKDVRSPERLLDEATLFLHQVESTLPAEHQKLLKVARERDGALDGRRILVAEDDARNIFALSSILEPKGAKVEIARNGREAIERLTKGLLDPAQAIDLVLMDVMMPEMDGLTAMREIRQRPEWRKLPIIALTAKAMRDDQEKCLTSGANDYMAKPFEVEQLLSLIRVWMPA
jgi:CheY-like chemotaxis protein/signal transduction histidine kinase/CHASE3 domain sensor protein